VSVTIADLVMRLVTAGAGPIEAACVVAEAVEIGMRRSAEICGKSVESPAEAALERRRNADKLRKRAKAAALKSSAENLRKSAESTIAPNNLSSLSESVLSKKVAIKEEPRTEQVEGRKRGVRLSADWQPDEELRQFARDHGVDPDELRPEFIDYWIAIPGQRGCKTADRGWPATWRNRVRQIQTFRKGKNGKSVIAAQERLNAKLAEFSEPDMLTGIRGEAGASNVRLLQARRSG